MPTYEYTCPNCGHEQDVWCKVSERKDQPCEECGEILSQRVRTPAQPHWTSLAMGSSASPEALKRFDKMRRQQAARESKTYAEHGDYGKAPGS
jgi:putative FmdB family regulatory protein